jgi:hypothetical protein
MPRGNSNRVRSAKLLKPISSRALSMKRQLTTDLACGWKLVH